ncbi:MAG: hypothetical protein F6J96_26495 [Symploca sp. SIO1C2]|nr:hypothetical protein [Symploca sp. SIO1C2]
MRRQKAGGRRQEAGGRRQEAVPMNNLSPGGDKSNFFPVACCLLSSQKAVPMKKFHHY